MSKSKQIAEKISEVLRKRNWSRLDLAFKCGKKPSVVTKWLKGNHNFTLSTLEEIENVIGVSLIRVTCHRKDR